jgi:hypothetical protein
MTEIGGFAGALAMLLDREEREVVLGDLAEGGMSSWQGSFEIAGLLVRRQVTLLQSWRTWAAGVGLALPASFLLMGASVAVSQAGVQVLSGHLETEMFLLLSRLLLLAAWAWTCGFVVVKLSRKTVWRSLLLCLSVEVIAVVVSHTCGVWRPFGAAGDAGRQTVGCWHCGGSGGEYSRHANTWRWLSDAAVVSYVAGVLRPLFFLQISASIPH